MFYIYCQVPYKERCILPHIAFMCSLNALQPRALASLYNFTRLALMDTVYSVLFEEINPVVTLYRRSADRFI